MNPTRHLLYKANIPKHSRFTSYTETNIERQQKGETKKHAPNARTGEIPRKKN